MTQLAESALSTVSSELNSLEAAVRVGNPATEDSSQARAAIDRALGALPETAKPMVPAGPDSGVYSVPMSSGTLVPDWSSNSGVPGHEQLAAAQEVVQHVLANLASSREELLSAAGALGLSSAVPADQARPGDSVLARAAGDLMAGADLSAVHGQLSVGGALKSLTP